MRDSDRPKPDPPADVSPAPTDRKAGRVVHDERGNAVWDWVVETGRIFIGNTSRLLRRLEAPELKIEEETTPQELQLESNRDEGGGYDPYRRATHGQSHGASSPHGPGARSKKPDESGGYDPYSSGPASKQGRKS